MAEEEKQDKNSKRTAKRKRNKTKTARGQLRGREDKNSKRIAKKRKCKFAIKQLSPSDYSCFLAHGIEL